MSAIGIVRSFLSRLFDFLSATPFRSVLPRIMPSDLYFDEVVARVRKKDKVNVVFIATSLSLWRYQNLCELMRAHPRFRVHVVILPFMGYSESQRLKDVSVLKAHFESCGIEYHVGGSTTSLDIRKELDPDMLFYPQPYKRLFAKKDDFRSFKDRLLCYYPYAFWMSKNKWSYNEPLHNCAWKLFYSTELHRKDACECADNKGCNVEVVGYPNADDFLFKSHKDVWKPQPTQRKRIIWAPHYSIGTKDLTAQSNFLWMSDFMMDVAREYSDRVQFAFKPHPRLYTELCKHPDWGEDRTAAYYSAWSEMDNTQLETTGFIDLFMTSHAMIHDSGSFAVEYHFTGNPVMYVATNFKEQVQEKGIFGQLAMKLHYEGKDRQDIVAFIEDVVLGGKDAMKADRERFKLDYLLPPNGQTVAKNTMDIIIKALDGEIQ